MAIGSAIAAVAMVSAACTQASEGKPVKIPTFGGVPTSVDPTPTETTPSWTPTWEASIPAPVIKPTTKTTTPPPTKKTVTPTPTEPTITIPTLPGIPFVREGARCDQEGAVGISRSGDPLVCMNSRGGLRWRRP
ncbi:hypothetical protein LWC34_54935 [Kibdelosporangium philippinense]|uniref:Uncharacterized protein n=1 Tax=Kibdelosporangium philippinense TaxID=211113 RepID=A0ABS8ZVU3_9PSEU|nr:hypothetical protein [Kibdelosporangium philippinense]MCE7011854.1 hypothetical protein [Kibdelosporangium philippinense]